MGPQPRSLEDLLDEGAEEILRAQALRLRMVGTRRIHETLKSQIHKFFRHVPVGDRGSGPRETAIDLLMDRPVCRACLTTASGLSEQRIEILLSELSRRFPTATDARCGHCVTPLPAYRLG